MRLTTSGNMGKVQGLETVLNAAERLLTEENSVHFYLIGAGTEKQHLKKKSREMGLSNVTFVPNQPRNSMGTIFRNSDVLLVHLKKDPIFSMTIPAKIQSYLMSGIPLLGMLDGEGAAVIKQASAGLTCSAGDSAGLAAAVLKFIGISEDERQAMGRRGRIYAKKEFDREVQIERMLEFLNEAISSNNKPSIV